MVEAYLEAKPYASALDSTRRAHLYLNGAYAYRQIKSFGKALTHAEEARRWVRHPATYDDSLALARTLHVWAETQLYLKTKVAPG